MNSMPLPAMNIFPFFIYYLLKRNQQSKSANQ